MSTEFQASIADALAELRSLQVRIDAALSDARDEAEEVAVLSADSNVRAAIGALERVQARQLRRAS